MDLSPAQQAIDEQLAPGRPASIAENPPPPIPRAPRNGLAMSLERRRLQLYLALVFSDALIVLAAFALVASLYEPFRPLHLAMLPGYLLLPLFLTIALYNGTYSREGLIRWRMSARRGIMALLVSALLLTFLTFFLKASAELSRVVLAASVICAALAMTAVRYAVARINTVMWGPSMTNRLLIDAGGPDVRIPHMYRVTSREHGLAPDIRDPVMLDRLSRYLRNMDQVIVSCQPADRLAWAEVLKGSGIHGEVISDFAREIGALGIVHHREANIYSILVSAGQLALRARVTKRLFDIAAAGAALLLLLPVLLACALAIKLEDGGAVFFRQRRMGRGNTFFDIYKFRSMREASADHAGHKSASRDDDRITRIGHFMRRTSVDELPQLINVLKGEMSTIRHRLSAAQPCHAGPGRTAGGLPAAIPPVCGGSGMIRRLLLWAGLALLAMLVVGVQLDRQAYKDPTVIRLVPGPMRAVAEQRRLELAIALAGRGGADLAAARHLVRLRPIPARHLLLYAQTAQLAGRDDAVVRPLEVAATRGWREPALQMLAGQAALAGGDEEAAVQRAAALIATGGAPDQTVAFLQAILRQPRGQAELARLLARPVADSASVWRYIGDAGTAPQVLDVAGRAVAQGTVLDCPAVRFLADQWRTRDLLAEADRLQALACPA